MRTAQNNISAVRKFCSYLSSYDLNTDLAGDRIKTRISAMMPRFTRAAAGCQALRSRTDRGLSSTGCRRKRNLSSSCDGSRSGP